MDLDLSCEYLNTGMDASMWTLAKTLSLLRMNAQPTLGHVSPVGTPPHLGQAGGHPTSILNAANQKALASRGYYTQQGWPKGTFVEADERIQEEHGEDDHPREEGAASKRRMFQKTRSRRNWSMCESGEADDEDRGKGTDHRHSSASSWQTKSLDDLDTSATRGDGGSSEHGVVGPRASYLSTTTESSTDSLDGNNSETERAFEEIRRQYRESQRRKERSSSEDLFQPRRKKRQSGERVEFEGVDDADTPLNQDDLLDGHLDLLTTGESSGTNYFISPASSRQTTIEKAPTLSQSSFSIAQNDEGDTENASPRGKENDKDKRRGDANNNSDDSRDNVFRSGSFPDDELRFSEDTDASESSPDVSRNAINSDGIQGTYSISSNPVQIIVSSSELTSHEEYTGRGRKSPSKLMVEESTGKAGSDSGSSSSGGTAATVIVGGGEDVGTRSVGNELLLMVRREDGGRLSESEASVTEKDSISRTHSPCGFSSTQHPLRNVTYSGTGHPNDNSNSQVSSESVACQVWELELDSVLHSANKKGDGDSNNNNNSSKYRILVGRSNRDENTNDASKNTTNANHSFKLASIPPTINPLELMKRLRHSQDELSRMGSVQSDSSGFGDADPNVEYGAPGPPELDSLKVASLGSSSESSGTLASSVVTTIYRRGNSGDRATQTGSSEKIQLNEEKAKQSPAPTRRDGKDPLELTTSLRYVTTCFIPSLNPRPDGSDRHSGLRLRSGHGGGQDGNQEPNRSGSNSYNKNNQQGPGFSYSFNVAPSHIHSGSKDGSFNQSYNQSSDYHAQQQRPYYQGHRRVASDSLGLENEAYASPHNYSVSSQNSRNINSSAPGSNYSTMQSTSTPRDALSMSQREPGMYSQTFTIDPRNRHHISEVTYQVRPARKGFVGRSNSEDILDWDFRQTASIEDQYMWDEISPTPPVPSAPPSARAAAMRNDKPLSEELAMAMTPDQDRDQEAGSGAKAAPRTTTHISGITINPCPTVKRPSGQYLTNNSPIAGNLSKLESKRASVALNEAQPSPRRNLPPRSRSCDILDEPPLYEEHIPAPSSSHPAGQDPTYPHHQFGPQMSRGHDHAEGHPVWPPMSSWSHTGYAHSLPPSSFSRISDDLETHSSVAESSSDFSVQSTPEGHGSGIMDCKKLGRLINQSMKGNHRSGASYRPRRLFKEWAMLSRRKRLQEENRLLQHALQKYKVELSAMETSHLMNYQEIYDQLTQEEREEIEELDWLYNEVKGQVLEMEQLLGSRIKSVHSGNDFHSLLSTLGVIHKMTELIKEQGYHHQLMAGREREESDRFDEDDYSSDPFLSDTGSRSSFRSSRSWMDGGGHFMSTPRTFGRFQSSSMSNLPRDLNVSLEQMKSSLLSQVHTEIQESTRRLEADLQEKDKEIQKLRQQIEIHSPMTSRSATASPRWTPRPLRPRSRSMGQGISRSTRSQSRSRLINDRLVQETDV